MDKFIPYGRQEINDQDITSVVEVLKSDFQYMFVLMC